MRIHVLLLIVSSQSQPAAAGRSQALLSSLKTKIGQANPKVVMLASTVSALVLGIASAVVISTVVFKSREEMHREIELSYRQREVFMRALVRGEREVVSAQLELDDFALERYVGLTIHYIKHGQHRLDTVAGIDRANNALRLSDSEDLVSHEEVAGVQLLNRHVQGRVVLFYARDAHLLDPSKEYLFAGRVSVYGSVAGVTSDGYLLVRPYVTHDDPDIRKEAFTSLLYLVHEQNLPTTS